LDNQMIGVRSIACILPAEAINPKGL